MAEFLITWDINGIEAIVPIGKMREENLIAKLSGESEPHRSANSILNTLEMRARFNPQRYPQIWGINVEDDIDEITLNQMADENPQMLVDIVKKHGVMLYGDPKPKNQISY